MKIAHIASASLACGVIIFTAPASACSVLSPPLKDVAEQIAARGVVIRGTIIQQVNARKRQPIIIRADNVSVGDKNARIFVIYTTDREYQLLRKPSLAQNSCESTLR